jgi:hexosaminidase
LKSPACQKKAQEDPSFDIEHIANYWAVQVSKILAQYDVRKMFAWEDGIRGTTLGQFETENVVVDFWEYQQLVDIAANGTSLCIDTVACND